MYLYFLYLCTINNTNMKRNLEADLKNMEILINNHIYSEGKTLFFDEENVAKVKSTNHLANDTYLIEKCNNLVSFLNDNIDNPEVFDIELEEVFNLI